MNIDFGTEAAAFREEITSFLRDSVPPRVQE